MRWGMGQEFPFQRRAGRGSSTLGEVRSVGRIAADFEARYYMFDTERRTVRFQQVNNLD